jgi:hypothetical protein
MQRMRFRFRTRERRRALGRLKAALLVLALTWCAAGLGAEPASLEVLTPTERAQFFERYFDRMAAVKPLARFTSAAQWTA